MNFQSHYDWVFFPTFWKNLFYIFAVKMDPFQMLPSKSAPPPLNLPVTVVVKTGFMMSKRVRMLQPYMRMEGDSFLVTCGAIRYLHRNELSFCLVDIHRIHWCSFNGFLKRLYESLRLAVCPEMKSRWVYVTNGIRFHELAEFFWTKLWSIVRWNELSRK